MNRSFQVFNFRAKAVLSMILVVAMHVVVGCGGASSLFPAASNTLIELTPDHPVAQALAGSPFAGATAVEVNPVTRQFRLIYPNGSHQLSGTMSYVNGAAQVKQLTLGQGSKSVTLAFGENLEVTNITTSSGPSWQRTVTTAAPQAAQAARAPGAKANTIEGYLSANADLMQLAQQMDAQGVTATSVGATDQNTDTGQPVKADAAFWPLLAVFAVIVFIPIGIFATLYFIFEIVAVINVIF